VKTKFRLASLTLGLLLISPASHATDWGNLLKKGNELLQEQTETSAKSPATLNLSQAEMIDGLKEALSIGAERTIDSLGKQDGYLLNQFAHIPLPAEVDQLKSVLKKIGMESLIDDFETSMNRAAEKAAPEASQIFADAIRQMTIEDAQKILTGPDNAATEYFRSHTSDRMAGVFKPIISEKLDSTGSTRYYNELSKQAGDIPFVGSQLTTDLNQYVTDQALDGFFTILAQEEKKIRQDPVARSTELLKKVFSNI